MAQLVANAKGYVMPKKTLVVSLTVAGLAVAVATAAATLPSDDEQKATAIAPARIASTGEAVVWAVGDVCEAFDDVDGCDDINRLITADSERDAVLLLGDTQYEAGTLAQFNQWFDKEMAPNLLNQSYPAPGNHEYNTSGAIGYYDYFGSKAGTRGKGWYAFNLNGWKIVAANSTCGAVGGCTGASEQGAFIRSALREQGNCEIVFDHHPFLSDGKHGDTTEGKQLFTVAYNNKADLFLSGHDHTYERFSPRRPDKTVDNVNGVRQVVVGTGGANLYSWVRASRGEYRQNTKIGALRLKLSSTGYTAEFINTDGVTMDSFSGTCH